MQPPRPREHTREKSKWNQGDLAILGDLMRDGKMTPIIDKTYSLSEIPDSIRYLETGHARGKVVVIVE